MSTAGSARGLRSTGDRTRAPRAALAVGLLLSIPAAGPAPASDERPAEETLKAIEQAGRQIALYHEAIARAVDQLGKEAGDGLPMDLPVVVDRRDGWHVIFLKKPSAPVTSRTMLMVADVLFSPARGEVTRVRAQPSPRPAPADAQSYYQALEIAEAAAAVRKEATPPFDRVILRDSDRGGSLLVYLQTRPEDARAARFGSDLRVTMSSDGKQVRGIEAPHAAPTVIPLPAAGAGQPTLHVHAEGDLPTESDVALILRHPALAPHLVLTPKFIFRIEKDGRIAYLGRNAPAAAGEGAAP